MKRSLITIASIFFYAILSGCSTHTFNVRYEAASPAEAVDASAPEISVGSFQDARGTHAAWLGAIRGGYGNPLKKLYSDQPLGTVVSASFKEALKIQGRLDESNQSHLRIEGRIDKLDCSYYFNREAHTHLTVNLVETTTNSIIYTQTYRTDVKEPGVGAGIFGNVDHLAALMQRTLNQTIDTALSDPAMQAATRRQQQRPADTVSQRFNALEDLHRRGLITDDEYAKKRQSLINQL